MPRNTLPIFACAISQGSSMRDTLRMISDTANMPIMVGIDATARIRERNPNACVLILTGGTTPGDVDRARIAGAAAYITKDRISTDLIDEIRTLGSK